MVVVVVVGGRRKVVRNERERERERENLMEGHERRLKRCGEKGYQLIICVFPISSFLFFTKVITGVCAICVDK